MLAAAEPQGAVAGTTAVLEGAFLAPQADYAAPLFREVADRFTVRVYRGATYSDASLAAVRAVLDRERPAHTAYHLCVVEPCMRVGYQARVGVDAVLGGESSPGRLGDTGGLVLAGDPAGRLGRTTEVGRTHLTDGPSSG